MAPPTPVAADLGERVSFVSNISAANVADAKESDYVDLKSPAVDNADVELEGGALREGGAASLLSRESIGLLTQYAAVGLLYAVLPQTIYPFLQSYLNADGALVLTANSLVTLPWSFKFFYGILSDCVPIRGYRRRPYMLIGWTMAILMLVVMAILPVGKPFWADPSDMNINPDKDPAAYADAMARANTSASSKGGRYIILMMLCAVGYLMSDVCADGVTVEYAQREPIAVRGRTQSAIYSVRAVTMMIGQMIVGFAFNGEEYGGTFKFSLSFPTLMLILAIVCIPVLPMTWFFIKEEKHQKENFKEYMKGIWKMLQSRAVYQLIFYFFFYNFFNDITYTASTPVERYMVKAAPINDSIANTFANLMFLVGLTVTGKYGLHWNWRKMVVLTGILVTCIDAAVAALTVWDVFRNQWFWFGLPLAMQLPYGINFLISTFCVVEVAEKDHEAATYGLMTTVNNLAIPFATAVTKIIDSNWDLSNKRIMGDSYGVRRDIFYSILVMYLTNAVAWFMVFFLPKQKEEAQKLKREGGSNKALGIITIIYVFGGFVFAVATNLMTIFPSTSCLVIAGGDGC
jgi:hypothetical protein